MDLSNLSTNLPVTKPISQESVNEVNRELAREFKNAAKLVTTLYNLKLKLASSQEASTTSEPSDGFTKGSSGPDEDDTSNSKAATDVNMNEQNMNEQNMNEQNKNEQNKNEQTKNEQTKNEQNKNEQNLEFANAAKSVASLYRLSNNCSGLNYHYGYLSCLNDLLAVISDEGDVENWALTKMAEFNKCKNNNNPTSISNNNNSDIKSEIDHLPEDFKLPNDHGFDLDTEFLVPYQFKPSYPPLSVSHSQRQRSNWLQLKKDRDNLKWKKSSQVLDHKDLRDNGVANNNLAAADAALQSTGFPPGINSSPDLSCSEDESEEDVGKKRKYHEKCLRKRKEMKRD